VVNGKPGDDPILDITVHGLAVYSDEVDGLIREVWLICGTNERDELRARLPRPDALDAPGLEELHLRLEEFRSRLLGEARERGWEGPPSEYPPLWPARGRDDAHRSSVSLIERVDETADIFSWQGTGLEEPVRDGPYRVRHGAGGGDASCSPSIKNQSVRSSRRTSRIAAALRSST